MCVNNWVHTHKYKPLKYQKQAIFHLIVKLELIVAVREF